MLNVKFEAMNIEDKYYEILRPYVSSGDCDEVIDKLLNLHSVSSPLFYCQTEHEKGGERCSECCNDEGECFFKK